MAIFAVAFYSPINLFLKPLRVVFSKRGSSVAPRIVEAMIQKIVFAGISISPKVGR